MSTDFKLDTYIKDNFDGILVVGDIHADYALFKRAADLAKSENYFFLSLGDLVDRGTQPFEVVKAMYNMMFDGRAGLIVGNHDNKMWRHSRGNKVNFSADARVTLECVAGREEEFFKMYSAMVEDKLMAAYHLSVGDFIFTHGGFHREMLNGNSVLSKTAKSVAMYGEATGETADDGYPVRAYNWIDLVPAGKTVIVGHDRKPVHNKEIEEPLAVTNSAGGSVMFIDTGCGKGGFLTGLLIKNTKGILELEKSVSFKHE